MGPRGLIVRSRHPAQLLDLDEVRSGRYDEQLAEAEPAADRQRADERRFRVEEDEPPLRRELARGADEDAATADVDEGHVGDVDDDITATTEMLLEAGCDVGCDVVVDVPAQPEPDRLPAVDHGPPPRQGAVI